MSRKTALLVLFIGGSYPLKNISQSGWECRPQASSAHSPSLPETAFASCQQRRVAWAVRTKQTHNHSVLLKKEILPQSFSELPDLKSFSTRNLRQTSTPNRLARILATSLTPYLWNRKLPVFPVAEILSKFL